MNHRTLLSNARYCGLVRATRRKYHVYESPDHFILLSPGPGGRGGNYHVVERKTLNYLLARIGGTRSITVREARAACRRSKSLQSPFAALNALYVLVALGKARIIAMRGPALVFAVSKGTV